MLTCREGVKANSLEGSFDFASHRHVQELMQLGRYCILQYIDL